MVTIYVLKLKGNKYYVGKTTNPTYRLDDHFSEAQKTEDLDKQTSSKFVEFQNKYDNLDKNLHKNLNKDTELMLLNNVSNSQTICLS